MPNEEDKSTVAYSAGHDGVAYVFDPKSAGSPSRFKVGRDCGGGLVDCEGTEVGADDPTIFMSYGMSPTARLPSDPKRVRGWLIHHVNLGIALKEKADHVNLEAHLKYPGSKTRYDSLVAFLVDKLLDK